jgi:hypothetical protein
MVFCEKQCELIQSNERFKTILNFHSLFMYCISWTREERLPFVSAVKTLPKNMRKIFLCRPFVRTKLCFNENSLYQLKERKREREKEKLNTFIIIESRNENFV